MKLARLLTLTTALLGTAAAAHAQTVSPNPAPTIITSVPYTITAPGYYQLGANLATANSTGAIITCAVGNVTIDFAGHFISGPTDNTSVTSGSLIGVYAYERGNIKVINGTVAYCQVGIEFKGTGTTGSLNVNQSVNNMLVTYCSNIGIWFNNTSFSSVRNSSVTNIGGSTAAGITGNYGLNLTGAGSVVDNDTVNTVAVASSVSTTAGYGMYIPSGSTATVTNNRIFNSYYGYYSPNAAARVVNYVSDIAIGVTQPNAVGGDRIGHENNF